MNEPQPSPGSVRVSAAVVFARFLECGLLWAWGGPVAQIPTLREKFTGDEGARWTTSERFDRALALYQALPGPEATEMCVWLGLQVRGRLGGLLAGLGFILPGLVLVMLAAWLYTRVGGGATSVAWLAGMQAAVAAMIVRAVHKLGAGVLKDRWLWGIALAAALAQAVGVAFWVSLLVGAVAGAAARSRRAWLALVAIAGLTALSGWALAAAPAGGPSAAAASFERGEATTGELLVSGLRGGALTFGGAFSLVPILHHDAVESRRWVSEGEFLDAIGVTGVLPAPMVMFGTFIAALAGGPLGALAMTLGLFLPAFAITLVGHGVMERIVERRRLHAALDGVTSAVVGVMGASGAWIIASNVRGAGAVVIFAAALVVLYACKSRWATPAAVGLGAVLGLVLLR